MANVPISAFTVGANTTGIGASGYSLTGSAANSYIDLAGTWNTTGTPTAIKLNITDTASNAASLLMDLQVGGTSRFNVTKTGITTQSGAIVGLLSGGGTTINYYTGGVRLASSNEVAWTNGNANSTADLFIFRDAAQTLAQRNSTNAQTLRVYNTFTDASNYERGKIEWASNVLRIGTEKAGTGSARNLELQMDGTTQLTITTFGPTLTSGGLLGWNGRSLIGSSADGIIFFRNAADTAGSALEMREQTAPAAPAADRVRIYAQDNGSGKTQLMALFATGVAQQIAIEP